MTKETDTPQVIMEETKRTRLIAKLLGVALFIIAAVVGIFIYWVSEDGELITLNSEPIAIRTIREYPAAGGVLIQQLNYCKSRDIEGITRTSLVSDTREVFLPLQAEGSPRGCTGDIELPVLIPEDLPPDTYVVRTRITYNINPLKQGVSQEFSSSPVEINGVLN